MAKKTILSVGYLFPGGEGEYAGIDSTQSLLDADIIVFSPQLPFDHYSETYRGKKCYSESGSYRVKTAISHWSSQIKEAFEAGKTIIIFLPKKEDVYVDTGERQYSGTGRNRQTTRVVESIDNYQMVPVDLGTIVNASGKSIKPFKGLGLLSDLWAKFHAYMAYEIYFDNPKIKVLLSTVSGSKSVGGTVRGHGTIVLLPPFKYDNEEFTITKKETDEEFWSDKAVEFGKQLKDCLIDLDSSSVGAGSSAPPDWASDPIFRLKEEGDIENKIVRLREKANVIQSEMSREQEKRTELTKIRRLLYEKGRPLEDSVLDALALLGFDVSKISNEVSEIDVISKSSEGRFIGEVEGKDNKAINISKLSQLERNIQEDYARDDVEAYEIGALFGNAFRFTQPNERDEFFTQKVHTGAKRAGIALVKTTDLFDVARYLTEKNDKSFAKKCRQAIAEGVGRIVIFPQTTEAESTD